MLIQGGRAETSTRAPRTLAHSLVSPPLLLLDEIDYLYNRPECLSFIILRMFFGARAYTSTDRLPPLNASCCNMDYAVDLYLFDS